MSLFLKIFLWFWLAIGLMGVVLFLTAEITQTEPVVSQWRYMTGNAVSVYAETAADMFEGRGNGALVIYLQKVEQASQIRAVLYNSRGEELSGRGEPAGAKELAVRARLNDDPEFEFDLTRTLTAKRILRGGGETYVLVGEVPLGRLAALRATQPRLLLLRLLAVLLTSGIVCFLLSRYLTSPLDQLRTGVRRFAQGDLSIRIGKEFGTRRDELADLGHDFDAMGERIESLVLAQRQLLGDISHELRSPLARIGVAIDLAGKRAGPEVQPSLERIRREADRLNDLIGQLLTLSRLESDAPNLTGTEVNLTDLVEEVALDADYEARNRGRRVMVVKDEQVTVTGSEELLRRAVENVVRNAVRYTAPNTEVEVSIRCQSREGRSWALVSVRDHGAGVPEETLDYLFRPFYRVVETPDKKTGGTGLGLAITERAVRLHGGTVQATNAQPGGLIVEINLPACLRCND